MVQLFKKSWHKSWRRTDFRVADDSETRLVVQTRRYGLLALGALFASIGAGLAVLAFNVTNELPVTGAILIFGLLMMLFGFGTGWASFTQRDTITIDRKLGTIEYRRARTNKRHGQSLFRTEQAQIDELRCVELKLLGNWAWLSFKLEGGSEIEIDHASNVRQLETLGHRLAAAAGSKLVRV